MPDPSGEGRDDLPVEPTVEAPYSEWISEVRRLYVEPKGPTELPFVVEDEPEDTAPAKGRGRGRLLGRGRRQQAAATPPPPADVASRPSLADLIAAQTAAQPPAADPGPGTDAPRVEEASAQAEPEPEPVPEVVAVVEEPVAVEEQEPAPQVVAVVEAASVEELPVPADEPQPEEPAPAPHAHHPVDLTDDPSWSGDRAPEPTPTEEVVFEAWPAEPGPASRPSTDDEPAFEAWPVAAANGSADADVDATERRTVRHAEEDATGPETDAEASDEPVRRRSWWDEGDLGDDTQPADPVATQPFPAEPTEPSPAATVRGAAEDEAGPDVAPVARRSDRHRASGRGAGRSSRQPAPAPAPPATGDAAPSFEDALRAAEAEEAARSTGPRVPTTRAESRAAARQAERRRATRRRRALVAAIVLLVVVAATWWVLRPHQTASADTTTATNAATALVVAQPTTALRS